jgi:hypothetical protein
MSYSEEDTVEPLQEDFNLPKLELLVRLGLMPLQMLPYLRRALSRLQSGIMLSPDDRKVLFQLVDKMLSLSLNDPAVFQRIRTQVTHHQVPTMENTDINEAEIDLKRAPEGMLTTLANSLRTKMRAGGVISITDKRIASRAKAELRRRRDNMFHKMREETEVVSIVSYEDVFKQLCIETDIVFNALSEEEKKQFLFQVDEIYKSN